MKSMKLLATETIAREYRRLEREMRSQVFNSECDRNALYGARQALAWALGQHAMIPTKCFGRRRKS